MDAVNALLWRAGHEIGAGRRKTITAAQQRLARGLLWRAVMVPSADSLPVHARVWGIPSCAELDSKRVERIDSGRRSNGPWHRTGCRLPFARGDRAEPYSSRE